MTCIESISARSETKSQTSLLSDLIAFHPFERTSSYLPEPEPECESSKREAFNSMYRYISSSLFSRFAPKPSLPSYAALRALPSRCFSWLHQRDEHVRVFSTTNWGWTRRNPNENVNARPDFMQDRENLNSRSGENANPRPDFMQDRENLNSRSGENANVRPVFMQDRENSNSRSENDAGVGRNYRPMDFVRGIMEEDGKDFRGSSQFSPYHEEQDADFVHIKMLRNNTFVTVTDSKGNVKLSGSAGSLKEMKAGQKLSRYAAEATAEVVGRRARGLGLKSVVMKVNGFTHFRRKRQAIMSWREGFTDSRGDRNPIVYIEDTTRRPHNGCRLPKKRRI